jgi:hypothetical protein
MENSAVVFFELCAVSFKSPRSPGHHTTCSSDMESGARRCSMIVVVSYCPPQCVLLKSNFINFDIMEEPYYIPPEIHTNLLNCYVNKWLSDSSNPTVAHHLVSLALKIELTSKNY